MTLTVRDLPSRSSESRLRSPAFPCSAPAAAANDLPCRGASSTASSLSPAWTCALTSEAAADDIPLTSGLPSAPASRISPTDSRSASPVDAERSRYVKPFLALDSTHRVYVTGFTCSLNFPVKNAFQPTTHSQNCANGGGDAFVARFNAAGTDLDYGTYLNGSLESFGSGIAVDSTFHAYVTGSTESSDFPTTAGAFQRTFKAATIPSAPHDITGKNAFVTKFSADGRALVYSTYLGGSASDQALGIALDSAGRACVTGSASSKDFPVTPGAFQKTLRGASDAFVTKLQITGAGLFYSTFLGGSGADVGRSIAVDGLGRAHVAGSTSSTNFPVLGAIQSQFGGVRDAFVSKLAATGGALFYSTYLGGSAGDDANSVRLDGAGNAYVGGSTSSSNFPTTQGAFSRTRKGGSDGWVAKISP